MKTAPRNINDLLKSEYRTLPLDINLPVIIADRVIAAQELKARRSDYLLLAFIGILASAVIGWAGMQLASLALLPLLTIVGILSLYALLSAKELRRWRDRVNTIAGAAV
jgi:hypothetical protein